MTNPKIILKPHREKSLLRGHPWLFSGAIERTEGELTSGGTVRVLKHNGEFLALGAYSPDSNIRVRVWSWVDNVEINREFFHSRIKAAVQRRLDLGMLDEANTACRLIFAESDQLPGLIADRYNDQIVVQFLSAGPEAWKKVITEELAAVTGVQNIYERSDVEVRKLEGLPPTAGVLLGDSPDKPIQILEDGLQYAVDVVNGHKTGFYLDQRTNRHKVRGLSDGKEILNCFAYTGSFTASALAGGAKHVVSIESSHHAVVEGKATLAAMGFPPEKQEWIEGDVFYVLRGLRDRGRSFDMIILDPPKFAATRKQAAQAARGYKDINLLAFKLLKPGGYLVTFSCSGGIEPDFFQKIVAGAALDAGSAAQIIDRLTQSPDHAPALNFPESQYLKGLVIQKFR